MSEIKILFKIKEEPAKEKIKEELNWYDIIKQEMLVFHGGKLIFKYREDEYLVKMGAVERQRRGIKSTYRMLPEVEDLIADNYFDMVKVTNQKEIENWFGSYGNYSEAVVERIDDDGIIFEVPDKEKEDFCDDLEAQGFRFND